MKEEIKERLKVVSKIIFHILLPTIIVFLILNIWSESVSNDTSIGWNIFVTIACFGAVNLVILFSLFVHFIKYIYLKSCNDR